MKYITDHQSSYIQVSSLRRYDPVQVQRVGFFGLLSYFRVAPREVDIALYVK